MGWDIKSSGLENLKKRAGAHKDALEKASVSAINKTAEQARTQASKEARKVWNVKASTIKDAHKLVKATSQRLQATLSYVGKRLGLYKYFSPKQNATGTAVKVKKGTARRTIRHAFIATMPTGHKGVFWREKAGGERKKRLKKFRGRLPIDELSGPSVAAMMKISAVKEAIRSFVIKKLPELLKKRREYYLKK